MAVSRTLIRDLRAAFKELADPKKAGPMQAYMKSEMPYLGIQTPEQRRASKAAFRALPLQSFEDWRDTVLALWRGARFREERYAAIELSQWPAYHEFMTMRVLPMYEEMIVSGAWWDYVDSIASHSLGRLLRHHAQDIAPILRKWALSEDIWKRRSAILAQLGSKSATDLELLYDCIRPSIGSREFFLRKGIGWALREYAKTNPEEVRRFVREHEAELSPLTMREALKNI